MILSTWSFHLRSFLTVTPNILADFSLKRNSVQVTSPLKVYSEFLALKWVQFEAIVVRPTKDIMYCILEHWCTKLGNNFRDRGVVCEFPYGREGACYSLWGHWSWANPGSLWNSGRDWFKIREEINKNQVWHVDIISIVKSPPPSWQRWVLLLDSV